MTYVGKKPADIIATAVDTTTGTFSGDLTVDTNTLYVDSANNRVGVGTSSPQRPLHIAGTNNAFVRIQDTDNNADTDGLIGGLEIRGADGVNAGIFQFSSNLNRDIDIGNETSTGALDFRTNSTQRMRITSTGDVGIGTISPNISSVGKALTINTTSSAILELAQNGSRVANFYSDGTNASLTNNTNNALTFLTNSTEKMRIDSSGNLLVGTTSINPADNNDASGSQLSSAGTIQTSASNVTPAIFNRGNDGLIVGLLKAGVIVGSIGTLSSRLHIENGDTGLRIAGDLDQIFPCGSGGGDRDAAIDLGSSGVRFKDLYLSGGVYLGGTGSANLLDDYEEGTWTPSFSGLSNTPTYVILVGRYTKIGRFVSVHMTMQTSQAPTFTDNNAELLITGLPFAIDGGTYASGVGAAGTQGFSFNGSNNDGNITGQLASAVNSSEQMFFFVTSSGNNRARVKNVGITNGAIIETTICYTAT